MMLIHTCGQKIKMHWKSDGTSLLLLDQTKHTQCKITRNSTEHADFQNNQAVILNLTYYFLKTRCGVCRN